MVAVAYGLLHFEGRAVKVSIHSFERYPVKPSLCDQ